MEILTQILKIVVCFSMEIIVFELALFRSVEKRDHFWFRIIPSLLVYGTVLFVYPRERFFVDRLMAGWVNFSFLLILLFASLVLFVSYKASAKQLIFYGVSAWVLQHLSGSMLGLVYNASGIDKESIYYHLVELGADIAVYLFIVLVLNRRFKANVEIRVKNWRLILPGVLALLSISVLVQLRNELIKPEERAKLCLVISYEMIICLLLVFLLFGFFEESEAKKQNEELENILHVRQDFNEKEKETIELMNIKYHDLKKQVDLIRSQENETERKESLEELDHLLTSYQNIYRTRNAALDTLLSTKGLYMEKYRIRFTCMADGKQLDFLSISDLYSLFGNALDNAIEQEIKEEEKNRIISLKVMAVDGTVFVRMSNYCSSSGLRKENGLPVTTKKDKRYHGYGVKSIRYVVQKYGGKLSFKNEDHEFSLTCYLPKKK